MTKRYPNTKRHLLSNALCLCLKQRNEDVQVNAHQVHLKNSLTMNIRFFAKYCIKWDYDLALKDWKCILYLMSCINEHKISAQDKLLPIK